MVTKKANAIYPITMDELLRKETSEADREAMIGRRVVVTGHVHLWSLTGSERVFYLGQHKTKFTPRAVGDSTKDAIYCKFTEERFDGFSNTPDKDAVVEGSEVEVVGEVGRFPGVGFFLAVEAVKPMK